MPTLSISIELTIEELVREEVLNKVKTEIGTGGYKYDDFIQNLRTKVLEATGLDYWDLDNGDFSGNMPYEVSEEYYHEVMNDALTEETLTVNFNDYDGPERIKEAFESALNELSSQADNYLE